MPHSLWSHSQCCLKTDADAARHSEAMRTAVPRFAGILAFIVWAMVSSELPAAADDISSIVHNGDGVRVTVHTDCDGSAYTLVDLTEDGVAERYAASDKFAAKIAPQLPAILSNAAAWLDGDGGKSCAEPMRAETITVIGVVNALPVYITAARRSAAWQPDSAMPDARDLAIFSAVLPPRETTRCELFGESVGPKIGKYRTQIFTIRAAHTTGQWSHMQALTKLVPLHQEIMGLVGAWSLEWQCPDVFALAGVAILADEERAVLLKWNERKIRARVAEASTPDEVTAIMAELYRMPTLPPVSSLLDIADGTEASIRYGGYLSPNVKLMETVFAGAAN